MEDEADEALLSSLGASAVVASDFEQKFVDQLEEQLKEAEEEEKSLEDGELDEGQDGGEGDKEEEKKDLTGVSGIAGGVQKEEVEFKMEPSNFLLRALTAPQKVPQVIPAKHLPKKKQAPPLAKKSGVKPKEKEETEQQRKIRNGEMTPFGSEVAVSASGSKESMR